MAGPYNNDKVAYPAGSPFNSPQPQYNPYNSPPPQHQQSVGFSGQQQYGQPTSPDPAYHPQTQPQYSQQPRMEAKGHESRKIGDWKFGMCDCFSDCGLCCLTCWCPCITYGKIHHRLRHNDLSDYSSCNGSCWGFCLLASVCGVQWVLSMMQRSEIRHKHNLDGSGCGDCVRHFCCECCSLIQEERELADRKALLDGHQTGYVPQAGMQYPGH